LFGCLVVWLFGCLVVWLFGCLVVWLFGCLVVSPYLPAIGSGGVIAWQTLVLSIAGEFFVVTAQCLTSFDRRLDHLHGGYLLHQITVAARRQRNGCLVATFCRCI
jgi:hypothetical protein